MRRQHFGLTLLTAAFIAAGFAPSASAADMPTKAPSAPQYVTNNWSGFYLGASGGYGWGRSSWLDDPALGSSDLGSHETRGSVIGGQIGYNYQLGIAVIGIEADANWASLKGNHVDLFGSDLNSKVSSLGTVTGRVGFAYWDRLLIYAKAGGAWGRFTYDDFTTLGGPLNGSSTGTRWGWVVGAGFEYAIAANWSARLEYSYFDFNTKRMTFSGGAGGTFVQDITEQMNLLKVGINYRFGP